MELFSSSLSRTRLLVLLFGARVVHMAKTRETNNKKRKMDQIVNDSKRNKASNCRNCKHNINSRKETSVKCTSCSEWIHLRCSILKSEDLSDPAKVNSVKCRPCELMEDDENEDPEDDDLDMVVENDESGPHVNSQVLQKILCEIKGLRKVVDFLQDDNRELKASMENLSKANQKLITQVEYLQKSQKVPNNNHNRSGSRVRMAADEDSKKRDSITNHQGRNSNAAKKIGPSKNFEPKKNTALIKIVTGNHEAASSSEQTPKLPSIKARINKRRLHISKICPSVTAEALYKHLKTHGHVHPITVKQLRGQGNDRRFYVEVLDVDYDNTISDELWDNDTEISYYRGPLRDSQVVAAYPTS